MKIVLDTNIVLDLLLERSPFFVDAKDIFILIEEKKIEGYLCPTTITTLYYLICKQTNKQKADDVIKSLLSIFEITQMDKEVLLKAKADNGSDFEDSVIYTSAHFSKIDFIITRDKKGFANSEVSVLPAVEFLAFFNAM